MNTVKVIYTDGSIELIKKPVFQEPVEVLIIFPKSKKNGKNITVIALVVLFEIGYLHEKERISVSFSQEKDVLAHSLII